MVGRKRAPAEEAPQPPAPSAHAADLNEIVAYNFRIARELRGWTQEATAEALEPLLGQRLPQASISAIERAYDGERRREFDAQEILAFALAFDLPLVWFFLPPPADHRTLHRTSNIVSELYGLVLGREDQLASLTTFAKLVSAAWSPSASTTPTMFSFLRHAPRTRRERHAKVDGATTASGGKPTATPSGPGRDR